MKITKVKIRNLFGIKEIELTGNDFEISGKNGVGKTSILDAISYALRNKSDRKYIIREGQPEGEVIIETDTGLKIHRKSREGKADYKSIKEDGNRVERTEGFLRDIFSDLQLNPLDFSAMDEKEQNRIILDLIDFKWSLDWIKEQFGEIVPEVNYEQNILCVLNEIQSEKGYYFMKRQDINREIREKKAFCEEIAATLPSDYNGDHWEKLNLGSLYKEIETIRAENSQIEKAKGIIANRDNIKRRHEADYKIEVNAIDREISNRRNQLEKDILKLEETIKLFRKELESIEQSRQDKIAVAKATFDSAISAIEGEARQFESLAAQDQKPITELQSKADHAEKMKSHVMEYRRVVQYQKEITALLEKTNDLTSKIERARMLPGEILEKSKIPFPGLTIKEGIPLINGLPISNLSEGEKFMLCINIAVRNPGALNILLIDGIEKLASDNREKIYKVLKDKGCQFIATRTTDDESLTILEL